VFVFADETGAPLTHRRLGRVLVRALAAAGLPELCWHDLRHVAASALIAQGVSVTYLSRLLGHASPAVTLAVYAHEFAKVEHGDRMREQMEAVYGGLLV
jgi:integrase